MPEPADHLADVLDGRAVPADAATRGMANIAARVATMSLASEPAAGWTQLDDRFARIITGSAGRKWFEGWGLGGRPRPLVQRLAAGIMLIGIASGASSAAGVTPGEALDAAADASSGIVRYITRSDGGPGPLTESPVPPASQTAGAAPTTTTTQPTSESTPNPTPLPASTTAPTSASGGAVTTPPASQPGTTTYAAGEAGTATLAFDGTNLSLVSTQPLAGWSASGDDDDDSEKVEVTFTNGDREVEFKAEVKDGAVSVETSSDDGEDD